jgi:hypothetical protein
LRKREGEGDKGEVQSGSKRQGVMMRQGGRKRESRRLLARRNELGLQDFPIVS